MKKNELASVIICNYNYGQYIQEAISSVIAQSYQDIEIIIVDDGSTDNSREIIQSFDDSRITSIYQKNIGQAAAFNTGFSICRGKYISFLDSDDYWFPKKIETTIENFKRKNISVVQHNLVVVDATSSIINKIPHPGINPGIKNVLKAYLAENHTGFFSATSGITCKKSDLDKIFPLDPEWQICADVAFTRPMPLFGNVLTCKEHLGAYRIHGSNNWMSTERQKKDWQENQLKYCDYTNNWLKRYGHKQEIDFSKSKIFAKRKSRIYKLKNRLSSFIQSYLT